MASNKRALAICDNCGFRYPHRLLKRNSYGMLVCPTDYDGAFDLKNHPQNKTPNVYDNIAILNPRPENNTDRNLNWNAAVTNWNETDEYWNNV